MKRLQGYVVFGLVAVIVAGCSNNGNTIAQERTAPETCVTPPDPSGDVVVEPLIHCYTPAEIRAHYRIDALAHQGLWGQGQTIVLVDAYGSPTADKDLQFFHDTYFPELPDPDFEQIFPLGPPDLDSSDAPGWAKEATLDIQWAYAIAPQAKIVLAALPSDPDDVEGDLFIEGLNVLVDEYDFAPGTVFSMSFGEVEGERSSAEIEAYDAVFQRGIEKGYTFFASSGDSGSTNVNNATGDTETEPSVISPTSSPYVTSVGGTQLQYDWEWAPATDSPEINDDRNPDYFFYLAAEEATEVVWNESWIGAASGGGRSDYHAMPGWQASVAHVIGADARGVPDVAWNAAINGGVLIYFSAFADRTSTGWLVYGGTSASAPQFAALTALINQGLMQRELEPVGHFNPLIYELGGTDAFNDIVPVQQGLVTSGQLVNNQRFETDETGTVSPNDVEGFSVLTGWDMCTGWGSPRADTFYQYTLEAKLASSP